MKGRKLYLLLMPTLLISLIFSSASGLNRSQEIPSSGVINYSQSMVLNVVGNTIVDTSGRQVILKGVNKHGFEAYVNGEWISSEGWGLNDYWDEEWIADNFDAMKRWGMNVMRLFIGGVESWINNPENFRNKIKTLVSMVKDRGLYVIVTFYNIIRQSGQNDPLPYPPYCSSAGALIIPSEQAFIDLWLDVANELKQYPNAIFEFWNEPGRWEWDPLIDDSPGTRPEARGSWFNVCQQLIDGIRGLGSDNLIIIHWETSPWWDWQYPPPPDGDGHFNDLSWLDDPNLPSGSNVIYSCHLYEDSFGMSVNAERNDIDWILKSFEYIKLDRFASEKPMIIGEIGCDLTNAYIPGLYETVLKLLNDWGLSYIAWWWNNEASMGGKFSLLTDGPDYQPNQAGQILIDSL